MKVGFFISFVFEALPSQVQAVCASGPLYPCSRVIEHTLVSFHFMRAIEFSLPNSTRNWIYRTYTVIEEAEEWVSKMDEYGDGMTVDDIPAVCQTIVKVSGISLLDLQSDILMSLVSEATGVEGRGLSTAVAQSTLQVFL